MIRRNQRNSKRAAEKVVSAIAELSFLDLKDLAIELDEHLKFMVRNNRIDTNCPDDKFIGTICITLQELLSKTCTQSLQQPLHSFECILSNKCQEEAKLQAAMLRAVALNSEDSDGGHSPVAGCEE